MISKNKYFLAALLSYMIWGFLPLLLKQLSFHNSIEIIFYRVLIAALLMSLILIFKFSSSFKLVSNSYHKSKKDFFVMALLTTLGAALLALNWVVYAYTVNSISIHTAAFAYMVLPIITALLAFFILGEKLNTASWVAICLSLLSCYILGNVDVKESFFVLIIAFTYSFYLISQRKNTFLPRYITLAFQMLLCAVFMLFLHPTQYHENILPLHFWIYITIIAVFFTITPLFLNLFALNGMKTAQVSFLMYISPIISFLIGIILYHEKITQLAFLSYFLLAISVTILNWEWIKKIFNFRFKSRPC